MTYLEHLIARMPPLQPPPENAVDWGMAEDVYGISFPSDFKQFVATYGNVIWCDLFRAIYPDTDTRDNCEKSKQDLLETLEVMFRDGVSDLEGDPIQLAPYPQPGGLLPCLVDTNTCYVCWQMTGSPDEWTVVKWYPSSSVRFYGCGLTELIEGWVNQRPPLHDAWGPKFLAPPKYGISR